jgi:hypothetical protein
MLGIFANGLELANCDSGFFLRIRQRRRLFFNSLRNLAIRCAMAIVEKIISLFLFVLYFQVLDDQTD